MAKSIMLAALMALGWLVWTDAAWAQQTGPAAAPTSTIETHTLPPIGAQAAFDPVKATDAYLARVKGEARARSNAYTEGGYWLLLVDTIYAVGVAGFLLWFRVSSGIRDFAERRTRSRFWQVPIYVGPYILLTIVLSFPLTLVEGFFREKAYGLMNQSFGAWFGDFLTSTGLTLIGATIALTVLYAAIRASGRHWWLWATAVFAAFALITIVISPVFVEPLFNSHTPMPESQLKHDVLSLARANGIPADNVYVADESRQSDRISAHVSGLFGTTRIVLNDNLLKRCTHDEVMAVLGHEMGHYVLDHAIRLLLLTSFVALVGFAFLNGGFNALTSIFGGNWDVRRIDDPAGLPVLAALGSIFLLLATPVTNTISRTTEIQADMFGINAAHKPDAFATVVLKLANYRKLDPSPWEEAIFYDHPSGRTRIWEMMRWKAEHLDDPDIKAGPVSPQ